MQVEMWSLDRIKPYENNPRINDAAVDPVVQSINEFGFRQPIVVDTDGVIIVGHTNYPARMPSDASAFYAKNVANLLCIMLATDENGVTAFADLDADEITEAAQLRPDA